MPRAPWFKMHPVDWLTDYRIQRLSAEQRGFLIQLKIRAWFDRAGYDSTSPFDNAPDPLRCSIPSDPDVLWRMAEAKSRADFEKKCGPVLALFRLDGDKYWDEDLLEQLRECEKALEAKRRGGKAVQNQRRALVTAEHEPSSS